MTPTDEQLAAALTQAAQGKRPRPFQARMPSHEETIQRTAAGLTAKKTQKDTNNG